MPPPSSPPQLRHGSGIIFAVSAYGLWGVLPVYFLLLAPAGPVEVVSWRILLTLVFTAAIILVTRKWRRFLALMRDRRLVLLMGSAGVLILVNWLVFVYAALSGQVVAAALGYFTNPIVTVLLGVLILREKLRPLQWASIAISAVAVVVLAIGYGSFPWIALALAFSFGFYGLIKKSTGEKVDAVSGLTLETLWLSPLAAIALILMGSTSELAIGANGPGHTAALLAAGVVTGVPLLLFAAAARRVPLAHLGFMQYLNPVLQLIVGVFVLQEDMPFERWVGFTLVWIALAVLTVDMLRSGRAPRRASLERT